MQDPLYPEEPKQPLDLEAQENYKSAKDHEDEVRKTFLEEVPLGMVHGPCTPLAAATICGCAPEDLIHGALGAKDEGDKIRTIHDATANHVNDRIRANQQEKTTAPTINDWQHAAAVDHFEGRPPPLLLKADVSKAHRRIKIIRKHWRFITAKVGDDIFINTVGTYGVASAQYYWGRLAALLLRLLAAIYPKRTWMLVYVDDFLFLLDPTTATLDTALLLALLAAFGCPMSWHKTQLGHKLTWLGYEIDSTALTAFPAEDGCSGTSPSRSTPLPAGSTVTPREDDLGMPGLPNSKTFPDATVCLGTNNAQAQKYGASWQTGPTTDHTHRQLPRHGTSSQPALLQTLHREGGHRCFRTLR
jgi:hypothetical protein